MNLYDLKKKICLLEDKKSECNDVQNWIKELEAGNFIVDGYIRHYNANLHLSNATRESILTDWRTYLAELHAEIKRLETELWISHET